MRALDALIALAKPVVDRFPRLAFSYRYLRDSRQISKQPRKTPWGFSLIGNPSMEEGTFEPDEVAIITKCLPESAVFINVGANIGYYCCIALAHGKPTVAFEPIELNLQYLYKNIIANGWEKDIEIFPIALSDKIGLAQIYGGSSGASLLKGWANTPASYARLIPTSTLDTVLGNRFDGLRCLFLVDIEGAEDAMLEGARHFLSSNPKPVWLIEISVTEHQPEGTRVNPNLLSTFGKLWEHGYEAWTAAKDLRLVTEEELRVVCETGRDTLLTHNFLFVEPGAKEKIFGS